MSASDTSDTLICSHGFTPTNGCRFGCTEFACVPWTSPGEDLQITKQAMLDVLVAQQSRRKRYSGTEWIEAELDVMHHAVNRERNKRGLPDIDRSKVAAVERVACGHVDYASKFALYCAELALPEVAR